jgi:hypothetical protein
MRGLRFVFSTLLMALAAISVRADGMLIAPSETLRHFSEQTQVAVIDIRSDKTAQVNLFISLMDTSGKSHEVYHFLPLQTLPKKFEVKEETLADAEEQLTEQFYQMYDDAWREQRQVKKDLSSARMYGALCGGLGALAVFGIPDRRPKYFAAGLSQKSAGDFGAGIAAPRPAISVQTTHSRTDVYKALKPEEIGALTKTANLPDKVNQTLRQYAGRPFALLRLQTLPRKAKPPKESDPEGIAGLEPQPGLKLTFAQEMKEKNGEYVYDYPLGTGQGWANPIPATRIFVTAAEKLPLAIQFPDREYPDSPALKDKGFNHSAFALAVAFNGRQMHFAQYQNSNEKRDVTIALRQTGGSKIIALHKWVPYKLAFIWIAFPLLALALWLGTIRLFMHSDSYAKEKGFFRAAWRRGVGSSMLLLILLEVAFVVSSYFYHSPIVSYDRWLATSDYSWILPVGPIVIVSVIAFLIIQKRHDHWPFEPRVIEKTPAPSIFWVAAAAGFISGIFYTGISLVLQFAFANWIGV